MTDTTRFTASARELTLAPGGEVSILLTSSDVRVRGVDGDVVTIRSRDGEDIDDEVTIEEEPGRIHIRDAEREFRLGPVRLRGHGSASLDVDVPRSARIACKTLSGDIEAIGVGAEGRWSTASGDVRITLDGGSVTADSMSGDVTVDASGAVGIRARSVSGDVRLRAPRIDALQASSTSGDIRIDADLGAEFDHSISSVSGDVEVGTDSAVRVETQSITGDVRASVDHRTEGSRGRRSIVVGDGSVRLSVRTTSGDIRLRPRSTDGAGRRSAGGGARPPVAPARPAMPGAPAAPAMPGAPAAPAMPAAPEMPAVPAMPAMPAAPTVPAAPVLEDASWVVAEAEAAPNLVRPIAAPDPDRAAADAPAVPWTGAESQTDRREAARLDILRALERGELDIEAASHRLEQLEDAGPRFFRGFC